MKAKTKCMVRIQSKGAVKKKHTSKGIRVKDRIAKKCDKKKGKREKETERKVIIYEQIRSISTEQLEVLVARRSESIGKGSSQDVNEIGP